MRLQDLRQLADELAAAPSEVCITITLPTHRHPPQNEQDPVRVRKAARAAVEALSKMQLDRDTGRRITDRLEALPKEVERVTVHGGADLGLACYVTPELTRVVTLSHAPPERVIVADEFSLATPITDVTTADGIDVIVLSTGGDATPGGRLYRLERGELHEHVDDALPMTYDVRDRETRFNAESRPTGAKRDALVEGFLNRLDHHLVSVFGPNSDHQVVVVGVERLRSHFAAVRSSALSRNIVAEIDGNFDHRPAHELAAAVQDAVRAAREATARTAVAELRAMPPHRTATWPEDIHQLARQGRIHHLLVESGATDEVAIEGVVIGDRIARTIRACFDSGATITIVPPGSLPESGGIAATTRW
jgi:hypothetical protein